MPKEKPGKYERKERERESGREREEMLTLLLCELVQKTRFAYAHIACDGRETGGVRKEGRRKRRSIGNRDVNRNRDEKTLSFSLSFFSALCPLALR
jgi:hypothetical protein